MEPPKNVLVVRIGANFTLQGLGVVVRMAVIEKFFLKDIGNKRMRILNVLNYLGIYYTYRIRYIYCEEKMNRWNSSSVVGWLADTAECGNTLS